MKKAMPDVLIAILLFALCLGVYHATLTPSLSYKSPDGNELATICYTLGLAHATGYPLYTWLGKLFTLLPVGDVAHRVNLMSAVLGAAGVGLLYAILRHLTGSRAVAASRLASAFGALLFGFSLTFWSQTGIAEVYAPNVFMVALTTLLLLQWARAHRPGAPHAHRWFWAFSLVYGLSLGMHLSNLGFAPAFVLFVLLIDWRVVARPRIWLVGALFFFAGLLQFLWLPYKAGTLNDALMLRRAPATVQGVYDYTLGAFPDFKFAFPLAAIPERIVLYLSFLADNVSVLGILAGVGGMGALLWRAPRRFFLLAGMYVVHVWFFIQYRALDIDVFFIPAHALWVLFVGYFAFAVLLALTALLRSRAGERRPALLVADSALAVLLALGLVLEVRANWQANDYSGDTAINDFYGNVFDLLPRDSALLGQGGVFGYDMFYFRLVYGYRPDVVIPMMDGPRPAPHELAGRQMFTTQPLEGGRGGGTPWSPPAGLVARDAWYVPVLVGQGGATGGARPPGRALTLYAVQQTPPDLVVDRAEPSHIAEQAVGPLVLAGYDLDDSLATPGGRLHLTLYWRMDVNAHGEVITTLGDTPLEAHVPGFGNLARYAREVMTPEGRIVVEDYQVVIPSTVAEGDYSLSVTFRPSSRAGVPATSTLSTLTISRRSE